MNKKIIFSILGIILLISVSVYASSQSVSSSTYSDNIIVRDSYGSYTRESLGSVQYNQDLIIDCADQTPFYKTLADLTYDDNLITESSSGEYDYCLEVPSSVPTALKSNTYYFQAIALTWSETNQAWEGSDNDYDVTLYLTTFNSVYVWKLDYVYAMTSYNYEHKYIGQNPIGQYYTDSGEQINEVIT